MISSNRFDGDRRQTRLLVVLSVAYLIVIAYCDLLTRGPSGLATVWPCNGLLAVGLLLLTAGRRLVLLAVSVAAHLVLDRAGASPLLMSALFSVLDATEAILVALVLHRAFGGAPRLKDLGRALKTIGLAMPATVIMALVGALGCAPILHLSLGSLTANWLFINGLGMAVSLPAALILFDPTIRHGFERSALEKLLCYLMVAATAVFAFARPTHSLPFLAFPAGVLAAFRLGPKGAAWTTLLVTAIAAPLSVLGLAAEAGTRAQASERMHVLQLFVGALFVTCLAAALALATQQRLKQLLIHRQALARRAQARAQAASQAKTDFLATMSHEIRTPLNSVLGFTRLLAERDDLAPDARRQVGLIDGAGGALLTLVNDVLDFSRVEAGRLELVLAPTRAEAVLREAAEIVALEAQAKGLTLEVSVCGEGDLHHELDAARLRQVALNLLNNAVKFTPAGNVSARLMIAPGPQGDLLRVEISDTGIGVPAELRGRLFERFSQGDGSVTRAFGGTGLGLAISKALIELMGGQIGMSPKPAQGSTFWFSLGARRVEPAAATGSLARNRIGSARILLVDDHPLNREIGQTLLTLAGCDVVTAQNGHEAVTLAQVGGFDVVLMDIHMPGMDGLTATRAIRALPGAAATVPIIAMSADALPQHIARCREAGMVDHVAKPIQRDLLYATVETWLRRPPTADARPAVGA
ncbi:response regulator [Caulobacter sp. RL271]|jgi:signal transduction histidine kinase/CheY-like chemotaxis protein|uniref:histidine kinase n=1 Tax=Caulobacter segnis TaxID=88688 RepID=A0ABY4ZRU5_9CAUL|nr:response regulator [Caulobacter segnis]USQ95431.1 response regulator [Caulobacter segnis]